MLTKKFRRRNFILAVHGSALFKQDEGRAGTLAPRRILNMGYRAPSFRTALLGLASMLTLTAVAVPADAASSSRSALSA